MKKQKQFITNNAVKYWKKEVKSGRLHVATQGEKIYILNGYNAFVIPNNKYLFETLVQPATLRPAPEDGRAYIWISGEMREEPAQNTVDIVERSITAAEHEATRTPVIYEYKENAHRIYKLHNGDLVAINEKYDSMVDFSFSVSLKMNKRIAPLIVTHGEITAVLMPVNIESLKLKINGLLED
jgi:hypothetical protein